MGKKGKVEREKSPPKLPEFKGLGSLPNLPNSLPFLKSPLPPLPQQAQQKGKSAAEKDKPAPELGLKKRKKKKLRLKSKKSQKLAKGENIGGAELSKDVEAERKGTQRKRPKEEETTDCNSELGAKSRYVPGDLGRLFGSVEGSSLFDRPNKRPRLQPKKEPSEVMAEVKMKEESLHSHEVKALPKGKKLTKDPTEDARTLFVGNLPLSVGKAELKRLLRPFGNLESIRLRNAAAPDDSHLPKKAAIVTNNLNPNSTRLVAYAKFSQPSSVQAAIKELHGKEVSGRHLQLDRVSQEKKEYSAATAVFVGNLPFKADEEMVRAHFEDVGEVSSVRIVRDTRTQLGKGFAFVDFAETSSVALALRLNGEAMDAAPQRPLRVTPVTKAAKTSSSSGRDKSRLNRPREKGKKKKKELNYSNVAVNLARDSSKPSAFPSKAKKKLAKKRRNAKAAKEKKKSLMS